MCQNACGDDSAITCCCEQSYEAQALSLSLLGPAMGFKASSTSHVCGSATIAMIHSRQCAAPATTFLTEAEAANSHSKCGDAARLQSAVQNVQFFQKAAAAVAAEAQMTSDYSLQSGCAWCSLHHQCNIELHAALRQAKYRNSSRCIHTENLGMRPAADYQGCMQHVVHLHVVHICCLTRDLKAPDSL